MQCLQVSPLHQPLDHSTSSRQNNWMLLVEWHTSVLQPTSDTQKSVSIVERSESAQMTALAQDPFFSKFAHDANTHLVNLFGFRLRDWPQTSATLKSDRESIQAPHSSLSNNEPAPVGIASCQACF
ncbi:hypothetical protein TKK_0002094 [Trichogramma kaykai]